MKGRVIRAAQADEHRVREAWGSLRWIVGKAQTGTEDMTIGLVTIEPGKSNPFHSHPNCEEALHLLRGRLRHSLGNDTVTLSEGDTIVVPAGVAHNATNVGEGEAEMVVVYSTGARGYQPEE